MSARTLKDITKALQATFSAPKIPHSLPAEIRGILKTFVDDHDGDISEEESTRANTELKNFWEKYVGDNNQKLGVFVSVLRELRPVITREADISEWVQKVVKPIVSSTSYKKIALEDAREFLVGAMVFDDDDDDAHRRAKTSSRLCDELLTLYLSRSRGLADVDQFVAPENAQVGHQIEEVLVAFGRKRPKDLLNNIADLVKDAKTRLQGLTLLSAFLRHQTPHLYLVINTPLIEYLLKCLMNDTSTTVLSVALTCLIMLLPHIPGSLGPYLPRLFLIYSRLLCWEKFSELSSEAQKDLVTDDRIANDTDGDDSSIETRDVGVDVTWERARPQDDSNEAATPELLTYFTYLYGLYPLNFMSYIRKPRRYLKNVEFPNADAFDLDQAVIRARTEQFRQVHLVHPNFYNMTPEEELIDPKWPKMDPADVVGECHGLCINGKPYLVSPGPPPTGKLPDIPPVPPLVTSDIRQSGQVSPVRSHASFRSGTSWRDTQSTVVSSVAGEPEPPLPKFGGIPLDYDSLPSPLHPRNKRSNEEFSSPQTNMEYVQRQLTLLRNELNFERWHKAQISQHVSQIMRRNVKEATVEAETLNLINANRSLKKQLEQAGKAREATIKDSALTRKQANSLELNMTERFNKLKQEQGTWQADADELRRLRSETKQYRELLVATEAREMNKSHQLELAKRNVEEIENVKSQLQNAMHKLHEYEYREFEFESAMREKDLLKNEKDMLRRKVQWQEQEREQLRQNYNEKIAELEVQREATGPLSRRGSNAKSVDTQALQQANAESQNKLVQLKKAHSRLLAKYTDLELEYGSIKTQLEALRGNKDGFSFFNETEGDYGAYDEMSDMMSPSEAGYETPMASAPSSARPMQIGVLPSPSVSHAPSISHATVHSTAGLTFGPATTRNSSLVSRTSTGTPAAFNQSAPLREDEARSMFSKTSSDGQTKKEKITPDSTVRVYGRGGAQNIKLKQKEPPKPDGSGGTKKTGGFRGLRNLV